MTDQPASPKPGLSRGLRIVFGLSLALNLLIVGALAGAWLRGPWSGDGAAPRSNLGRALYAELPREERAEMRRHLRQTVDRSVRRAARLGPELYEALKAQPFDSDAVRALMDRQATALATGQSAMRDAWLRQLTVMSPEDRAAYADRVQKWMETRRPDKPLRE